MSDNHIASRQAGFLIFTLILGSAVIYMPESMAGRDAWTSTLLAAPMGIFILLLVISIQNMFPGMNMLEISEIVLGKFFGNVFNAFYIWLLFLIASFYLYDLTAFLNIIIMDLKVYTIYAIIILAAAYCLYKGINAVARLVELLVWLIPFFIVLSFIILIICCSDFSHLTPVLADLKPVLAASIYTANWPFAQSSVLMMYLPFVTDLPAKQKVIYIWYIIAASIMVMRSALTISVMGEGLTLLARFPLYEAFRLMKLSEFQRIELFFFALVFITGLFALLFSYQGLIIGIQKLFKLQDMRHLILPAGLLLIVLTSYMFRADLEILFLETMVPFSMLPIHILYPSIIFAAAKIYQKKKASPGTSAR